MRFCNILCLLFILIFIFSGCAAKIEKPIEEPVEKLQPPLALIPSDKIPCLIDDLNWDALSNAIEKSISYYGSIKESIVYSIGQDIFSAEDMKESLLAFKEIISGSESNEKKNKKLKENFRVYKATGYDGRGTVLFTGYFEPIMEGSLQKTMDCRYPIYKTPSDVVTVNLEKFRRKYSNERIVGRVKNGELVPYFSRADIDGTGLLMNKKLELVWVNDPVDLFFLHIQGSGKIKLTDNRLIQVSYAQSNGRPYRSIGRYLLEMGKLSESEMSHALIKRYLKEHPNERSDILNYNESYIFFRLVEEGPVGAMGLTLTASRSIATDLNIFPKGMIAFIKLRKPIFNDQGRIETWEPFSRFVLNQDTGGVIKGAGRVDLFCGTGTEAEMLAGSLKEKGELYFFIKKRDK